MTGAEAVVMLPFIISFLAGIFSLWVGMQLKAEKDEKKELRDKVQILTTQIEVIKETVVTEVSLRDFISARAKETDLVYKKEMQRLEDKIDGLTNMVTQLAQHLPKRGDD